MKFSELLSFDDVAVDSLLTILIEQSFEAILITDGDPIDHKIIYANAQFCRQTGYTLDELVGKSPAILKGRRTDKTVIERLKTCLAQGQSFVGAATNYKKDGTEYPVQWNVFPIAGADGTPTHFVSLQKDLTELKGTLNQLKASSQLFRKFLGELKQKPDTVNSETLEDTKTLLKQNAQTMSKYIASPPESNSNEDDWIDDVFFVFDDAATSLPGESTEKQVLSASALFESDELDFSSISQICEISDNLRNILEVFDLQDLHGEERKEFVYELQELANYIFYIEEFVELSIAISELSVALLIEVHHSNDFMVEEALKGLTNDLFEWVERVFVKRDAENVHWLDESIKGSCKQILVFLRMQREKAGV